MLTYNTQRKRLVLPEYGRNIQRMVDHCITIEDREERTRCAKTIIASMANLFPELKNTEGYDHKLWDHLAIMADFKLDIDFPCEVVKPDTSLPDKLDYKTSNVPNRQYGSLIESMVAKAVEMEESAEREALVLLIANHMKKLMLSFNKEGISDERVFKDLAHMSHGAIRLDPATVRLHEFKEAPTPTGKKKKKK